MIHSLYINLDERIDRKIAFENQFSKEVCETINLERYTAIRKTPGFLGCSQSHIQCLKIAKERGWDSVLIFEDDFELLVSPETFLKKIEYLITQPWDVCLLSGFLNKIEQLPDITSYVKVIEAQTAAAYIVRSHYYDRLLENFQEGFNGLERNTSAYNTFALDQYWKRIQPSDNWICSTPILGRQASGYSNIEGKYTCYDYNYLHSPINQGVLPPLTGLIILNCNKYKHKRDIQKSLWLPNVGPLFSVWYHVIGDPSLTIPIFNDSENILYVPCADDYLSLPQKTYFATTSLLTRFPHLQHIVKTDDDMTCRKEDIQNLLYTLTTTPIDYMGFMVNVCEECTSTYHYPYVLDSEKTPRALHKCVYACGRFYVLSNRAVKHILHKKDLFITSAYEDNCVGYALEDLSGLLRKSITDKSVFFEY